MTDGDHERVVKDHADYREVVKDMEVDMSLTSRQREVNACFSTRLPMKLQSLAEKHDGNVSAVLDEVNESLDANGVESKVSRGTIYNWFDAFDVDS